MLLRAKQPGRREKTGKDTILWNVPTSKQNCNMYPPKKVIINHSMRRSFRDAWLSHRNMNLREQVRVSLGNSGEFRGNDPLIRICQGGYCNRVRYINPCGDEYHLRKIISDRIKRKFDHINNH